MTKSRLLIPLFFAVLLIGCEQVETVRESLGPRTPHERYADGLAQAGMTDTNLGQAWHAAAEQALNAPTMSQVPFRDIIFFDPAQPSAQGYRFSVERGRKVLIDLKRPVGDTSLVFAELFRVMADSAGTRSHLHTLEGDSLRRVVKRDETYVLRIQPELLRGGRYELVVRTDASLGFPVADKDSRAIRSFFGASRDGGRRKHHGVDIFAPKGTPAIAAADGSVRLRNGGLGGKTVWLNDHIHRAALYYAHLDTQLVRTGDRVRAGDTLGLVGNTGNARTTPPHLHFGIYQNGPHDPLPFIETRTSPPPAITADTSRLGHWNRVTTANLRLRAAPTTDADVLAELPLRTPATVIGSQGSWYRVALPDGTTGYLSARLTEPAMRPLRQERLATGRWLHITPASSSIAIDSLAPDVTVPVLGTLGDFLFVETTEGRRGWIAATVP